MTGNRYLDGVAHGRPLLGAFCCLDGFSIPHILATAGFDFLVFDRQHAAYTWPELEQMCFRTATELYNVDLSKLPAAAG